MKSNYRKIGDYIQEVNARNSNLKVNTLLGINIDKYYMPSVANTVGTDMSVYKIVKKNQFACNRMHVGRDYRLPVALSKSENDFIVSPAYDVFEIIDTKKLLPEYLMLWFSRKEFDRNAWFFTDADVRGGLPWKSFCEMELPVLSPEKQLEIVKEYHTIINRIELNNQLIHKIEEMAQAIYKQWFVEFEFPDANDKPYKSSDGKMEFNKELEMEIPKGWKVILLSEVTKLITKGTTPNVMFSKPTIDKIFFLKGESFSENHGFDESKLSYIDKKTNSTLKRSIVQEDDILLTIAGTLGKFAKASRRILPANTNQAVAIIRVDQNKISPNFLFWLFLGDWHKLFIAKNLQQAVQANLSLTTVGLMPLIVPKEDDFKRLDKLINPIVEMIQQKLTETQLLKKLGETLLEKLATIEN